MFMRPTKALPMIYAVDETDTTVDGTSPLALFTIMRDGALLALVRRRHRVRDIVGALHGVQVWSV
jgi:hypothetical protein